MSDTHGRRPLARRVALSVRLRHKHARLSARDAARSNLVSYLAHASYLLLESYRADGTPVATPMRFAVVDETIFLRTAPAAGKLRRIAREPLVRVAACTVRGLPVADNIECAARVVPPQRLADARAALARRCGPWRRLIERLACKSYVYLELTPIDGAPRHPEDPAPATVIPLRAVRRRMSLPRGVA